MYRLNVYDKETEHLTHTYQLLEYLTPEVEFLAEIDPDIGDRFGECGVG